MTSSPGRGAARGMSAAVLVALLLEFPGRPAAASPRAAAVRVAPGAITLDGRLHEDAWSHAVPIGDFVQREPDEGAPAADPTEVRFAYDDDALYVGARMWARPGTVQSPLGPRDDFLQAESLFVTLDSLRDRRTAYAFGVSAAGVRHDVYHPKDEMTTYEASWDPVWEARTARDDAGWTAEMRIPFSQLRFTRAAEQAWGLNVDRYRPGIREHAFWVMVPKTETGWASRFGELSGLAGLRPRRRLEFLPYAAGATTVYGAADPRNPFTADGQVEGRAGGDAKIGLGPDLTLDATVNPDFGQVEADPAEVNLTAFETFFAEKRPFFVEGAALLRGQGPGYYYSRRIGAAPRAAAAGDFVDAPRATTILGAVKLSGLVASRTSVGVLAALTGAAAARTFDVATGDRTETRVAPPAFHGVARAQQQFGASGSTAGFTLTAVGRDLQGDAGLSALLPRSAVTGGGEAVLRLRGGAYELRGFAGFSHVSGDPAAIERLQRSSARYYQRPDQDHATLDAGRTTLSGWTAGAFAEKKAGRHWLWRLGGEAVSPGFELNDAGSLQRADVVAAEALLRWRETVPGRVFRSAAVTLSAETEWSFGGERQETDVTLASVLTWKNFVRTLVNVSLETPALDPRLARGGPAMRRGAEAGGFVNVSAPASARTRWNVGLGAGADADGGSYGEIGGGVSLRPASRWEIGLDGYVNGGTSSLQYVTSLHDGPEATFGRRYVFSAVDRVTTGMPVRVSYLLSPTASVQVYGELFAASGRFHAWGELRAPGARGLRVYGAEGTGLETREGQGPVVTDGASTFELPRRDFMVRSFRANVVLRWEWRPGSTFFAVWQQDRFGSEDAPGRAGLADLLRSPRAPGDHHFIVKASVYLPLD